ncbi:hypothetical protein MMC12_005849 [Toensbergia leucococca]|nr:hypothetical protein [Toensbergia leucococca]
MLQIRRSAFRFAKRSYRQPSRRYDSTSSHSSSTAHHAEPVNESLGRGFYVSLGAIPLSLALYKFSSTTSDSADPFLTRLINSYSQFQDRWTERNALHTSMIEQAAHDRNLFQSSPASKTIELKFPEIFNTGSPYNIPAGHSADLSALIAHYEKKNAETEEKRMKAAKGEIKKADPEELVRRGTY